RQLAQVRHVELQRERERELLLVDQPQRDQHLAEQPTLLLLLRERALDRIRRDAAAANQDLADALGAEVSGVRTSVTRWEAVGVRRRHALPLGRRRLSGVGLAVDRRRRGGGRRSVIRRVDLRRRVVDRALGHRAALPGCLDQRAILLDREQRAVDLLDQ